MKLGVYVCSLEGGGTLRIYDSPGERREHLHVSSVANLGVVRVISEEEYYQKDGGGHDRYSWWWVPVVTIDHKFGWVIFCHGDEKQSHFEWCGK